MSLFFRLHSDRTQTAAALEDTFAGTTKSACWLIGGGPSLSRLPYAAIRNSPLPKMCINLAGCEMRVRPSREQLAHAAAKGVLYRPHELLKDFVERCGAAGISAEALDTLAPCPIYHFAETKPLKSAANTDHHYFRVAQYLRLSRRAMGMGGLQLISVTPHSRLNDYFQYVPVRKVLQRIAREVGDPSNEPVQGQYQQTGPQAETRQGPMRDYRPHHWPPVENVARLQSKHRSGKVGPSHGEFLIEAEGAGRRSEVRADQFDRRERLREKLAQMTDAAFDVDECG